MTAKIALVIGHNERAQGAVRVTDGRTEYDWNGDLADMIKGHDPDRILIFRRKAGLGYSREIDDVYRKVSRSGAACSIELHFNGSSSPHASGTETLHNKFSGSTHLAKEIQSRMVGVLGLPDRGLKLTTSGNGYRSLVAGKPPAVLIEPYFGTSPTDCRRADVAKDQLAEAIYRGAMAFMGEALKPATAPSPQHQPAGPDYKALYADAAQESSDRKLALAEIAELARKAMG